MEEKQYHPVANIFPMMGQDDYQSLLEDIRENGLLEPIWLHPDGTIIDGRNRYKACLECGYPPSFRTWDGTGSLVSFVVSLNLKRRHLTQSQKAMLAVEILPMLEEEAKKRQVVSGKEFGRGAIKVPQIFAEPIQTNPPLTPFFTTPPKKKDEGEARTQASKLTGVNRQYVSDAKKIKAEAPDLAEKIMQGKTTIQKAKQELRENPRNLDDDWPEEDRSLKKLMEKGYAVVVNLNKNHHVIAWAKKENRFQRIDRQTEWGNPFVLGEDGTRDEVIEKYKSHYLPHKNALQKKIETLKGCALGCHCYPEKCHGNVLADKVNYEK